MNRLPKKFYSTFLGNRVFLDNQSTTPLDARVFQKMIPYFTTFYGNPHSNHSFGKETSLAIEEARSHIATLINAQPKDIIFTSGATESNNHAIKGVAELFKNDSKKHIITVQTEHKCVLESCKSLEKDGFTITYLPVQSNGIISLDEFKKAIK